MTLTLSGLHRGSVEYVEYTPLPGVRLTRRRTKSSLIGTSQDITPMTTDSKKRVPYPKRKQVILRRFLSQIIVFIFGVGLAVFYLLFNADPKEANPVQPTPPSISSPSRQGGSDKNPALQGGNHAPPAPANSTVFSTGHDPASGRTTETAPDVPYAGQSLGQVADSLAARFGATTPAAWGERLEGITTALQPSNDHGRVLALTLDACGGKKSASYDGELIAFLRRQQIPATIFVTSLWMQNNPDTLRELAEDPLFEIAAHGSLHRPCSVSGKSVYGIKGTADFVELVDEVEGNLRDIESATGTRPRWFRSGTAYYDDVAVAAISALGVKIAGYSIAGDQGATLAAPAVAAKTMTARPGDILLYHVNKPKSGTRAGLMKALPSLVEQGYIFVRLSDLNQ